MHGFSIFLHDDWSQEKERYVHNMADIGFDGVFTSLHIPEDDVSMYELRLKPLLEIVKARNLKLMADISSDAIRDIGLSLDDPKSIYESGFSGLRLDYGFDMKTVAHLSHYLTVGLNASTLTEADYEQLVQNSADFNNVEAWHNYYPRPDTGLDEQWFQEKNTWLRSKRLRISAFVPGDRNLRLPLYETLPTLEEHRYQSPFASSLALMQDYKIHDVYIGDPGISSTTRRQFEEYLHHGVLRLRAASTDQKWDSYIYKNHQNRLDVARDVVRSEPSRTAHQNASIQPENTISRKKGSITIDNYLYGRYKGELQVVKQELKSDEKVNVIGHITNRDLPLLDFIQGGMTFKITDIEEDNHGFRQAYNRTTQQQHNESGYVINDRYFESNE